MTITTDPQHRTLAHRLGRWAVPSALLLAATTMGPAHAAPSPGDIGAFDPGAVCSASIPVGTPTGTVHEYRLARLVVAAHAASVHAARW